MRRLNNKVIDDCKLLKLVDDEIYYWNFVFV